ncbi:MAG: hypothetical protein [Caudoviricetes sp.]|nr:MAG: hypothetical protein [Caudoviricetes sp.]
MTDIEKYTISDTITCVKNKNFITSYRPTSTCYIKISETFLSLLVNKHIYIDQINRNKRVYFVNKNIQSNYYFYKGFIYGISKNPYNVKNNYNVKNLSRVVDYLPTPTDSDLLKITYSSNDKKIITKMKLMGIEKYQIKD